MWITTMSLICHSSIHVLIWGEIWQVCHLDRTLPPMVTYRLQSRRSTQRRYLCTYILHDSDHAPPACSCVLMPETITDSFRSTRIHWFWYRFYVKPYCEWNIGLQNNMNIKLQLISMVYHLSDDLPHFQCPLTRCLSLLMLHSCTRRCVATSPSWHASFKHYNCASPVKLT